MSIRLPSHLIFMWRLFRWQRKWLNAEKSAVESLAMNSFQTSSSCVFQVRYKLHQQNVSDGLAQKADLKKYLAATMTKERESAALAPMNISLRKLHGISPPIDTFARKHP